MVRRLSQAPIFIARPMLKDVAGGPACGTLGGCAEEEGSWGLRPHARQRPVRSSRGFGGEIKCVCSESPRLRSRRCWCFRRLPPLNKPGRRRRQPCTARARPASAARGHAALTEKINQNTITVISGNPNGTYIYLAFDMSAVLDSGTDLRVLPVIGKGGYQNVMDMLYLRGIDLCITQSNIMTYLKKIGRARARHRGAFGLHRQALQRRDAHPGWARHQLHPGSQRQARQPERRGQRHAVLHPAHFRAAGHQGAGGQLRPVRRLPAREVGRHRRHHPDRRQADGLVRQVQAGARHDAAAGPLRRGPRAGLFPGQAHQRRLPQPDPQGQLRRHRCRRRGAGLIQLAPELGPLPPRSPVRRRLLLQVPRVPEAGRGIPSGGKPTSPPPCAAGGASRRRRNG